MTSLRRSLYQCAVLVFLSAGLAAAQQPAAPAPAPSPVFDMGEIVVVAPQDGASGVGGAVLTQEQMQRFDRKTLDQAVNVVPGVVSTFDSNGRRNESDIFVRGFGRWQVPLMMDGVRIYLPADNRLDFSRFLTADIAAVQINKGYASVLDGPGAMGGSINLVTRKPLKSFEAEGSASIGGRDANESWDGYAMAGARRAKYYVQGSVNYSDRDFWTLSSDYAPTASSLQKSGRRLSSDAKDSRLNGKVGFTPNQTDEYTFNYTKQDGEKGAPLNVITNPPVPPNSFWRWPYWDVRNTSFLTRTKIGASSYLKTKTYYNTFKNGLDAFDDITYTSQSANGRFNSPYDDHAYGVSAEIGTTQWSNHDLKTAVHYRSDFHIEQQVSRPTHPTLRTTEPKQEQAQYTWSVAAEDTIRLTSSVDLVGGVSVDKYGITKAQEFNAARGIFEYPKGGAESFNWQGALVWRYRGANQFRANVSDRTRFPVIFELYSTRFGTATPNPDLGPERATNLEFGWKGRVARGTRLEAAVFFSDVRDLIQTVVLADNTTQTQNVGHGHFAGTEFAADVEASSRLRIGANYTFIHRTIKDALQPNLRPTGVPAHKAFLYAVWQPTSRLTVTPSVDVAGDRWSDMNTTPVAAFPYIRTGAYTMLNAAAEYTIAKGVVAVLSLRNLTDDDYQLAWGFPQPGRTISFKTRVTF